MFGGRGGGASREGNNEDVKGTGIHRWAIQWEDRQNGITLSDVGFGQSRDKGHFYLEKK